MENKGFTLLELILCISIISILLIIPLFKIDILENLREKQELKEFIKDINYARNKAVMESVSYSVYLIPSDNSYRIYKINSSNKECTIKHKKFQHGVKLRKTNIGEETLYFNPRGSPNKAGTIILENRKGNIIEITIAIATGKVNLKYRN